VPSDADPRWRTLLEKRKVEPGDEILYTNNGFDVQGKVQKDGRIKHSSRITGDAYFIDAVAFARNFARNFAGNVARNLFATCYRCDDDDKVQSLDELLSSCDSIGAPGVVEEAVEAEEAAAAAAAVVVEKAKERGT